MGSAIEPLMADVCMNWMLNEVSRFNPKPCVIFRYIDDLFCGLHDKDDLEHFFIKINSIRVNIQLLRNLNNVINYCISEKNLHKIVYEIV